MSKKILITGGAGFIGFHLARRLQSEGYQICLVDNFSRGILDPELQAMSKLKNIKMLNIDCRDIEQINSIDYTPEIIFHLAAIIGVKNVNDKPYNVLIDNLRMLENIISFARSLEKFERLFFSSTSEVYAGTLENFDLVIPTKEKSPLSVTELSRPRTTYMLSKIYGEAICHHSGLPFTIFRPHNVYGPRMGMSHVIPQQLFKAYQAKNGDSIEIPSANQTRSFCYIDDAVEILVRMMNSEICKGKTLNLGVETDEIKIFEAVQMCWNINNKKILPVHLSPTEGSPERRAPDMKETLKILGNINYTKLEDGIGHTYDWYLKNIFTSSITGAL
jgi:nucleoside-diphosphate-sugar epimerase